jgi:hypothetical protein
LFSRTLRKVMSPAITAAVALGPASAVAGTSVGTFAVEDYHARADCSSGTSGDLLGQTIQGASNFSAWMAGVPGYSRRAPLSNGQVSDLLLIDPDWEIDTVALDGSSNGVDPPGGVISWFGGHGWCGGDGATQGKNTPSVSCHYNTDCKTIGPWYSTSNDGVCRCPPPETGNGCACAYPYPHEPITCSTADQFGGTSFYNWYDINGDYHKRMRLGESPNSGAWGGAGTNGGLNALFLNTSCGAHWGSQFYDMNWAFAGLQLFGAQHVVTGDVQDNNVPPDGMQNVLRGGQVVIRHSIAGDRKGGFRVFAAVRSQQSPDARTRYFARATAGSAELKEAVLDDLP